MTSQTRKDAAVHSSFWNIYLGYIKPVSSGILFKFFYRHLFLCCISKERMRTQGSAPGCSTLFTIVSENGNYVVLSSKVIHMPLTLPSVPLIPTLHLRPRLKNPTAPLGIFTWISNTYLKFNKKVQSCLIPLCSTYQLRSWQCYWNSNLSTLCLYTYHPNLKPPSFLT